MIRRRQSSRPGLSRRSFLRGSLAVGAAGAAAGLVPSALRSIATADGDGLGPVFPTIVLQLRGGWDPVMHFDARTGYVHRDVSSAKIRETAAGIRFYEDTLSPMLPHMDDLALLRNIEHSGTHSSIYAQWYGRAGRYPKPDDALVATPWTNYYASALLDRVKVPAPNITSYYDYKDSPPFSFVEYNNRSPNPLGAAQRIRNIQQFANAIDISEGLPALDHQRRVYTHVAQMDARTYDDAVQPRTTRAFTQANAQADDLLGQPVPPLWPPDDLTRDAFNLSDEDLTDAIYQGVPSFNARIALAYQLARFGVSHVVWVPSDLFRGFANAYDTHRYNAEWQREVAGIYWPKIARLIAALKATESTVLPGTGLSMFDTTHVVIATEMGRTPFEETADGTELGTAHWKDAQIVLAGGRFKRGYAVGALDDELRGVPFDRVTGALGGSARPNWNNVVATVMKANGVDASGWRGDARPIDAVLQS